MGGCNGLSKQSGNFLLQALLALSLIFAFIPFFASHIASNDRDTQMYSTTRQVDLAQTAARIFIRENASNINYDTTVVSGPAFSDLLEPYGLPLGFVPRTPMGQDIALVIKKTPDEISAYLELSGGDLSGVRLAELSRRIGFYASVAGNVINVGVPLDVAFSDVVRRNEPDVTAGAFLTDLDMGGFIFDGAGNVAAHRGEFDVAHFGTLTITGTESGKKVRNDIADITADRAVFQSAVGQSALSLSRGALAVDSMDARTVSMFGDTGNFTTDAASVYEFSMTAGRNAFTGPGNWDVHGNVVTNNINFSVERLDVSSYVNVSRGQDVFINSDTLEYSSHSGIETGVLITSNVTMRDQTSNALNSGDTGAVVLDIRPAGTSILPDAYVDTISNASFEIIDDPAGTDKNTDCKSIIAEFDGVYNERSLSQYIICQYMFWSRLERRIDIKQCMIEGRSDCIK